MIGTGGDQLFRAVCSCGWRSDIVTPLQVRLAWEDHVDEARRQRGGQAASAQRRS